MTEERRTDEGLTKRGTVNERRTGERRRFSDWGTTEELGTGEGERFIDP
jgi:hypothetical protein